MINQTIIATLVADFEKELDGKTPVAHGVGLDGSLYVVVPLGEEPRTVQCNGATFPKSRLDVPMGYDVLYWQNGRVHWTTVPQVSLAVSYVQPISGGLLLVGARCRRLSEGPEHNALVADLSGNIRQEITFGDGIEDVRVARDGAIWVSYFDEGVFGNFSWGSPGPAPIGARGLVAFTPQGDIRYSYDPSLAESGDICDVYATNVTLDGSVWIYFYDEFPIVRMTNGRYEKWKFGIGGAHGIAIDGDRALLVGDYERRSLGRILCLANDGVAHIEMEAEVVTFDGKPIEGVKMYGVGSELYLFKEARVWTIKTWRQLVTTGTDE